VSKKKGMLSWLGLGKQEDQKTIEGSINEQQDVTASIETSLEVTPNDIAKAKTIAEQSEPALTVTATEEATHLKPEMAVNSIIDDVEPKLVGEVSSNPEQTEQINETGQTETKLGFFCSFKTSVK
jgi:hypothetical protein